MYLKCFNSGSPTDRQRETQSCEFLSRFILFCKKFTYIYIYIYIYIYMCVCVCVCMRETELQS